MLDTGCWTLDKKLLTSIENQASSINFNIMKKPLTPFQRSVLRAALSIPLGQTRSYQWVAKKIGRPKAARAVGQALRRNPYPLIIPCHRVVCANGKLGGYAGKFDGKKARLLKTEQIILGQLRQNKRKTVCCPPE